jgi:hypothetical protein
MKRGTYTDKQDLQQIADLVKDVVDRRFDHFEGEFETRLDKRFERDRVSRKVRKGRI